jgi:hypothetical protein
MGVRWLDWLKEKLAHAPATEFDAKSVANFLFQKLVESTDSSECPLLNDRDVTGVTPASPTARTLYHEKVRLYRIAAALMFLQTYARESPNRDKVVAAFERLVFPPKPDYARLNAVRHAMKDLASLLDSTVQGEQTQMIWARLWLEDVGIEQPNPARLLRFALMWLLFCEMVIKFVRDCSGIW